MLQNGPRHSATNPPVTWLAKNGSKPRRQACPLPAENSNRPFSLRHKRRGSGQFSAALQTAQEKKVAAKASSRLSPRLQKKRKQAASHHLPLAAAV
ncbi:hypothetical protein [Microbulbifer epialgicus]|uniref:Uncharacterized protein n=1 Tax=Microbulbifer epialgicus TaxID=393907 RepID=A0ABV4P7T6_9GAMM